MEIPNSLTELARHLQRRKETHSRLYHLLLARQLDGHNTQDGYRALALLVKNGYFSIILVMDADSILENALGELSSQLPLLNILTVGQSSDEQVAAALNDQMHGISIIKLQESHNSGMYSDQFLDSPGLPANIQDSLQRYLNQDIIIVGSPKLEKGILRTLRSHRGSSIYYILSKKPTLNDGVIKIMKEQRKPQDAFLISGLYGEFTMFFKTLASLLPSNTPGSTSTQVYYNIHNPAVSSHRSTPRQLPASTGAVQQPGASSKQPQKNPSLLPPMSIALQPAPRTPSRNKVTTDVLLVTVTPVEARAILDLFPGAEPHFKGNGTYHDLGLIGKARTFMIQSPQMGSGGPGGSRFTVSEGIETLSPSAVIMVGIAFGSKPKVQRIGDILVSEQILDYDPQRVGSGPGNQELIYPRGNRAMASVRLLDRFTSGQHSLPADWQNPPKIYFGLVLSGAKLVDNKSFRDRLLQIAPEAIGGEMEGAGLYDAASRSKVDWVLVKGICDWADGKKHRNKSQNQHLAAENAARFVIYVIQQGGFTRQKPGQRS